MSDQTTLDSARSVCSRLFCADRRTEALFCLALLPEGTDVVQRCTSRFMMYRDNMTPEILAWIDETQNVRLTRTERPE